MSVQQHGTTAPNMATKRVHGVHRVLSKLEQSVSAGNYYEAHQMYRTLYFRYLGQSKYSELVDLLHGGSILLLEHDQQTSGADLGILLVDVLMKSETPASDELYTKLSRIFEMIGPDVPERETYLSNALQWSAKVTPEYKNGDPEFHQAIAYIFWKEKNYTLARHHFLHSMDGAGYATMLVELHITKGYYNEVDLFIAQAVLQYLCLHNTQSASDAFYSYISQHPNIGDGPPFLLPLLNFLWFLLETVESGQLATFVVLVEKYEPSIKRDPTYREYLDKIAQIFFGVTPPKPKAQGLFGNLLQSFLGGLEDSDSDEEPITPAVRPSTSYHLQTNELD